MKAISDTSRSESQYQMSDTLYVKVRHYIKKNDITFQDFCDDLRVSKYMLSKIMNRNIKMYCYRSLLVKIAERIGVSRTSAEFEEMQPRKIKY